MCAKNQQRITTVTDVRKYFPDEVAISHPITPSTIIPNRIKALQITQKDNTTLNKFDLMEKLTSTQKNLLQDFKLTSIIRMLSLVGAILLSVGLSYGNGPCTAILYDFGGGGTDYNLVPCGPSANTTSSFPIDGNGAHVPTGSNIAASDLDCAVNGELESSNGPDVLWVSFVVQEGGSFEWQTVAGADKFTWSMFYASDPVDMLSEQTSPSGCDNLIPVSSPLECGDQFTGWRIVPTPDPTKMWRFYIAYYINDADKDNKADGVVKIRKSCGLACEGQDPTVDITVDCTAGTLTATSGFQNYIWSNSSGTLAETSNVLTPGASGVYSVVAFNDGACPGTAEGTLPASCCDAVAGTISGFTQDETLCVGQTTLDLTTFSTDADPQPSGYSYALFLVDGSGNISNATAGTSTSFTLSGLSAGMHFIYGVSYLDSQAAADAAAYVGGFATLAALEADIAGGTCAELAMDPFKLTIVSPSCGTLPQN